MSDELIDTIKYRGFNINIYPDENAESPRKWDNIGTIVCFHPRYNLGEINSNDHDKFLRNMAAECLDIDEDEVDDDFISDVIETHSTIMSIYMYDHSGITISTSPFSCSWDSGQVGYIYVSHETIRKSHGWKEITPERRKMIKTWLNEEIKTYDKYLKGEVFYYEIKPASNTRHINCDDMCHGFLGYDWYENGLFEYAKNAIDCAIKRYKKEVIKDYEQRKHTKKFMSTCWAD